MLNFLCQTNEIRDTHKLSIFVGYQHVHLWAFGADDLTLQRVLAQINVAAICLVDGDSWDLPHNLETKGKNKQTLWLKASNFIRKMIHNADLQSASTNLKPNTAPSWQWSCQKLSSLQFPIFNYMNNKQSSWKIYKSSAEKLQRAEEWRGSKSHSVISWNATNSEKKQKKSCTHLDLDILAVNHLHDAHNVIKHQAHFLTVICRRKINKYI